nr:hypothetical protein [Treponema sp.]
MDKIGLEYLCTEDSITVFWEKMESSEKDDDYELSINSGDAVKICKTDYTFEGLEADKEYSIVVKVVRAGEVIDTEEISIKTLSAKKRIDVTMPPYNAVADGNTINTIALQKALDDCQKGECVYFPKGEFLTGGLRLHSDMEIYLDEGAVLLGSEKPEDYLPKIHSRFEGKEMDCYQSLLNMGNLDHNDGYNCK